MDSPIFFFILERMLDILWILSTKRESFTSCNQCIKVAEYRYFEINCFLNTKGRCCTSITLKCCEKREKKQDIALTNKSAIWKSRSVSFPTQCTCNDVVSWLKVCSWQVVDKAALWIFITAHPVCVDASLSTFARFNGVISHSAFPACLSWSEGPWGLETLTEA